MSYQMWKTKAACEGKPEHTPTCNYQKWAAPVSECPCDCYEKAVYEAGRKDMRNEVEATMKELREANDDKGWLIAAQNGYIK